MFVILLAMAIAIGGTLIALRFGDRTTRLLSLVPISLLASLYVPQVAANFALQLVLALAAAGSGLSVMFRARRLRVQRAHQRRD